ncbi:MAG TPA: helix-turn-helix transcriptional regulator [Thermoanaerobaculia bacterium]|nr:helix-turn-helix transcriptional regulator [Thermoanaerobaculia bacterium]
MAKRLKELIEDHGYSVKSLEAKMGRGRGYLREALSANKRLTVELILEVLAALEVPTEQFFARPRPRRPWHSEIAEPGHGGDTAPTELPSPIREDSLAVRALVLELADKGVITLEDLQARLRDLSGAASGPDTSRR